MKFMLIASVAVVVVLSLSEIASGEEMTCPEVCTLDFKPVCGKVGDKSETFPNRCAFEITECKNSLNSKPKVEFLHEGKC